MKIKLKKKEIKKLSRRQVELNNEKTKVIAGGNAFKDLSGSCFVCDKLSEFICF